MEILRVDNLKKVYGSINKTVALESVSFSVDRGEFVAIMGESGAGKTTLLNILATLDRPSAGSVIINGQDLSQISHKSVTSFRRNELDLFFKILICWSVLVIRTIFCCLLFYLIINIVR